jgi:hypothetical protein
MWPHFYPICRWDVKPSQQQVLATAAHLCGIATLVAVFI